MFIGYILALIFTYTSVVIVFIIIVTIIKRLKEHAKRRRK